MTLVFATALSTWVLLQILNVVDVGGFLIESTIAVVGGALVGFLAAWFIRRQRRKA